MANNPADAFFCVFPVSFTGDSCFFVVLRERMPKIGRKMKIPAMLLDAAGGVGKPISALFTVIQLLWLISAHFDAIYGQHIFFTKKFLHYTGPGPLWPSCEIWPCIEILMHY